MALIGTTHGSVWRVAGFSVVTPDANQLASFYERALGFRQLGSERRTGTDFERSMGVHGGAYAVSVGLGQETVELVQFDSPGRPYPAGTASSNLIFQHFAIVVSDMGRAYERLSASDGWTAISTNGPVELPEGSGGVKAFKFRDPNGHPLELLAFPDSRIPARWQDAGREDVCLGIDHSAISVSNTARSVAFYEALGLCLKGCSLNRGSAQEQLDAILEPDLEVTALVAAESSPHIELLCYRNARHDDRAPFAANDVAATRMNLDISGTTTGVGGGQVRITNDPDGHFLVMNATPQAMAGHGQSDRFSSR